MQARSEVEHIHQRAGHRVEGSPAYALSSEPIVLNEAENGRLVSQAMVDKVGSGPARYHQQGKPWAVSATALEASQGVSSRAATPSSRQSVGRSARLVDNRRHHVVVPAIGVVVSDNYSRFFPLRELL